MSDEPETLSNVKTIDINTLKKGSIHSCHGGLFGGNTTYSMFGTNNRKYFFRDTGEFYNFGRNAETVVASKFARMISKKHFSSEKWRSDGQTVSLSLPETTVPHPQPMLIDLMQQKKENSEVFIKTEQNLKKYDARRYNEIDFHINGTGTIDEVCAFINEKDPNIQNIMFSDENFDAQTKAIKIDFDDSEISSDQYSPDDYHHYGKRIYDKRNIGGNPHLKYARERALAKLKIALVSDEQIHALIKKYCPQAYRKKFEHAIKGKRDKTVKDLLKSNKYGIKILMKQNEEDTEGLTFQQLKTKMNDFTFELSVYAGKHFDLKKYSKIKTSLNERNAYLRYYLCADLDPQNKKSFEQFHNRNVNKTNPPEYLINKCDKLLAIYKNDLIECAHQDVDFINKTKAKIEVISKIRNASSFEKAQTKFYKESTQKILSDERDPIKARILRCIAMIISGGFSYFISSAKTVDEYLSQTRSYSQLKDIFAPSENSTTLSYRKRFNHK